MLKNLPSLHSEYRTSPVNFFASRPAFSVSQNLPFREHRGLNPDFKIMKRTLLSIVTAVTVGIAGLVVFPGCEGKDGPIENAEAPIYQKLYTGGSDSGAVKLTPGYEYAGHLDYSNDDFKNIDNISILRAGEEVLNFKPRDTGNWGNGWENIVSSSEFRFIADKEDETFEVRANRTDEYGFYAQSIILNHVADTID